MPLKSKGVPTRSSPSTRVKPPRTLVAPRRKDGKTVAIIICTILAFSFGIQALEAIQGEVISAHISTLTGYEAGSPDNFIIREYIYNVNMKSLPTDYEYEYRISNGVLFVLSRNQHTVRSNLFFPYINGAYPSPFKAGTSINTSGEYMRADLNALFSEVRLVKSGRVYALMLVIDARSDEAHIAEYRDMPGMWDADDDLFASMLKNWEDSTYAVPDALRLFDQSGAAIESITCSDGAYRAYYVTVVRGDTAFALTAEYEGKDFVLLTYEDIVAFNVQASK